ncbi:MAG TPA: hypothetical protein VF316_12640 [Polyangiaceae bacterium]
MRALGAVMCGIVVVASACGDSASPAEPVTVRMSFARPDFFAAPFPSDDRMSQDGHIDLSGFPNPSENLMVEQITGLIARDARGFATTGGVFLSLTGDVDPASLPDMSASTQAGASVSLVAVDDAAPDFGRLYPVSVSFAAEGGDYAPPHLLSIVPLQGIPLRSETLYAAVVTRKVKDTHGAALGVSADMQALARGTKPAGMSDAAYAHYGRALAALAKSGVDAAQIAGLAVFTTGDPAAQMLVTTREAVAKPVPPLTLPITRTDVFDGYCVYSTQLSMPDYQSGTPPFDTTGGDWAFDPQGHAIVQRLEPAHVVLTVPRATMPAAGYPLLVMIRTGGGGDRPLVDRGVQSKTGGPPLAPGTGPAMELAAVGYAGASIDGPHGGLRNVTQADEQFLMFNVANGAALRDNVRESALEIAVFEHVLEGVAFDASDCPGAPASVKFDTSHVALMGHSMGATIAPLTLATEPRFRGAVLSGAGASWIENILYKEHPVAVRPLIELLLGYSSVHRVLLRGDPMLTMMQWALEPADPMVYTRLLLQEPAQGESPRQILMEQGIVDHYILPPIANGMSLSLGLDLAGAELDLTNPELVARPELTPLANVLGYAKRTKLTLPASANFAKDVTAIVVQHPEDGLEDGHEVMFQTEAPKSEYRCFLQSLAQGGAARVPDGNLAGPCP